MSVRFPGQTSRFKQWSLVSLVFGLVLICYWPALHGALLWDDPAHVPRPDLRSWDGLRRIWLTVGTTQQYYPVLFSAFWLEHRLWGDNTLGYHLVNVGLHATSCCLLALFLRRLWSASADQLQSPPTTVPVVPAGAEWFAALLFAVHPICVESVAWITEQKNTLSLVFYLLAGLAYLNFNTHRRSWSYALASGLFLLALGSKTSTVTLPAALLVVIWWKNGKLLWRREVCPLLPWFFAAVAMGLFTSWVERKLIGAEGIDFELSVLQRVLLAGRIIWFYVATLVWPVDLNFFYRRWDVPVEAGGWIGYLAATVALTIGLWAIRLRARGPLAGWLLFVGSLFPILGFFKVFFFRFSYVNDHFVYLASLGIVATMVGAGAVWLTRAPSWARTAGCLACSGFIVVFAVLTNRQSQVYRDNVTLFRSTVLKNPDSWMGHHILGVALAKFPELRLEAITQYEEALQLNPSYPDAHLGLAVELGKLPARKAEAISHLERAIELRPNYAEAHNNLSVELGDDPGRAAEALAHGEAAVRIKPDFAEAHNNLAYALAKLPGRLPEAIAHYEEALRLKPDYTAAHFNLANALAGSAGHSGEAIAHYEQALRLDPDSAMTHFNLANTLVHLPGRLSDAISHYEATLRIRPDSADAHANLGNALSMQGGREADALTHYEAALQINPGLASVHFNVALLLSRIPGRLSDAITHDEAALQLKPDYLEAYNGLAILFAQQGRLDEAKTCWEKALQVNPSYEAARQNLDLLERMQKR